MNKYFKIILILFFFTNFVYSDELDVNNKCKIDSDCILFVDECNKLFSISKNKIMDRHEFYQENGKTYYHWKPTQAGCLNPPYIPYVWSKFSVAKCINLNCVIKTKEPKK